MTDQLDWEALDPGLLALLRARLADQWAQFRHHIVEFAGESELVSRALRGLTLSDAAIKSGRCDADDACSRLSGMLERSSSDHVGLHEDEQGLVRVWGILIDGGTHASAWAAFEGGDGGSEENPMQIEPLGVYWVTPTEEVIRARLENWGRDYGDPSDRAEALQFIGGVALVEVMVLDTEGGFDVGDFIQLTKEGGDQVAWAETYLTLDGEGLICPRWQKPPEAKQMRIAFFIHFWDPLAPLGSSFGPVMCPPVQQMPERLIRLAPYEIVD